MNYTRIVVTFLLGLMLFPGCATRDKEKRDTAVNFIADPTFEGHVFLDLPYSYSALEPYIDSLTMEIHYQRHHRGYYNNFMKAIEGKGLDKVRMTNIFEHVSTLGSSIRDNGGGFYNHELFWANMAPNGQGTPSAELLAAIESEFGSLKAFKEKFSEAAITRFGSGWAWLSVDASKRLFISSTPNQDNPLMDVVPDRGTPLLGLDVWEHAYYLKYQNRRADYVANFWNVVNWDEVNERYRVTLSR